MSIKVELVTAEELLPIIWPNEKSRPSLRWLRTQQDNRAIPYVKMGRLVFFDPEQVRAAIADKHTIKTKKQ